MRRQWFWMAPAVTLALAACGAAEDTRTGGEESPGEQPLRPTAARSEVAPAEWKRVAPGVWERARADGGHEQIGIGVQALKAELQRLRVERALRQQVSAMGGTSGELAGHLRESDQRIHFLETGLAEFEKRGVRELAQDEELLRSALGGSEGTPSGP